MAFKVQVGPPQIAIHQAHTVLVTDHDGQMEQPSDKGLYFFDTRMISHWKVYANGEPWELLNGGPSMYYAARIYLTNPSLLTEDGAVPARTLGLVLGRSVDGGLHEDLDLTNYGARPVRFQLEISIRSDFADIFEAKSNQIVRRGRITTNWLEDNQELVTSYRHEDFCRELKITTQMEGSRAVYANGRLSFEIALEPTASWHCCLLYALGEGEGWSTAPPHCADDAAASRHAETLQDWQRNVMKISTSNEEFYRLFHQAVDDMAALRLPIGDTDHMVFLPAAGLPWYVAPFGRDSLIVSLQNLLIYPDFAKGALEILGSLQARERDDYRDAEPGKILHEMRCGELAHFKLIPHTPYYGTADATPLYLITLHATWLCTGDRELLLRHLATAERGLAWIDRYGDRDGDGFQEYQTRSSAGYENMGWKDSGDAVMYPDGSPVRGPKALCELQGYVYDAWLRMAEVYDVLNNRAKARKLRTKAAALFAKFNEAFWDEEAGFYALALDGDKRKVMSIASNAGHCLWSGIVPRERAERVVARLMRPDMWSGWGIRTLSAQHPSFNPFNYQTGSVWPHDNGIIALGFRRYGFAGEAAQIARDISRAAEHFLLNQLPELYAGVQRDKGDFPVQYLGANVPQAWAAGSAFMLLQAMIGFQPDGPHNRLFIDPNLPRWLPDLTLRDLRVGEAVFDIRFCREDETTTFEVLRGDGDAVIRRDMTTAYPVPSLEAAGA